MAPDDLPRDQTGNTGDPLRDAAPGAIPEAAPIGPRQTLAMRLAERNRQRALRAERLARLHSPGAAAGPAPAAAAAAAPVPDAAADAPVDAAAALEDFLKALTADCPGPPEGPPVEPAELLPFQRPAAPSGAMSAGDLDRLPGVGPGLVWALERAGFRRLADLAPLAPAELAARLGPLGRLVPAERWIALARETAG